MKFIFEVLVEVNDHDEWGGFKSRQHFKDYDGDVGGAIADALAALELDLDTAAEEAFEGLNVEVTVNQTVEEWNGKEPE